MIFNIRAKRFLKPSSGAHKGTTLTIHAEPLHGHSRPGVCTGVKCKAVTRSAASRTDVRCSEYHSRPTQQFAQRQKRVPALLEAGFCRCKDQVGAHGARETPVPIPNTAVKPRSGYYTWPIKAWENSTVPNYKRDLLHGGLFL